MSLGRPLAALVLLAAAWCSAEPSMEMAEARRQIAALVPRGQRLVTVRGLPYVYLHDLDGDGQPEAFALSVDAALGPAASVEELARYGRLFEEPGAAAADFRLLVFANTASRLDLARSVDLGRRQVLAAMDYHRISRDTPAPFALSFIFQTVDGAEHLWIVVSKDPRAEPARTAFPETLSSEVSALDVDGDGVLDIVTVEHEIERTGVIETYLTWFRWSGRGFAEHASTVVVRNLEQFLAETRTKLLSRSYEQLVNDALEPAATQRYRRAGLRASAIIAKFFPGGPELDSVRDIVLPDIRESPFRLPSEAPSSVVLDVRIVDASGTSTFAQIVVAIARNPFVKRQFSLLPVEAPRS